MPSSITAYTQWPARWILGHFRERVRCRQSQQETRRLHSDQIIGNDWITGSWYTDYYRRKRRVSSRWQNGGAAQNEGNFATSPAQAKNWFVCVPFTRLCRGRLPSKLGRTQREWVASQGSAKAMSSTEEISNSSAVDIDSYAMHHYHPR